jgi:leader peptidase (prepilin peptidase) / N-methyltransferase
VSLTLAAVFAVPGLAVGSFLNVVASRVPLRLPIGASRSRCLSCSHEIAWHDNVPLLSFLALGGRCRRCRVRIPARYPAVEALSALLVGGCFLVFGLSALAALASFFCLVLVVLSAIDLEHRIVPNRLVLPAAAIVLATRTAIDPSAEWAAASFGAALGLLLVALAYPKGMGMGDVKLCLLLGAMLGRSVPVAIAIGIVTALLPAVVVMAQGRSARKLAVPFAPFLALGSVVTLFWGDAILDAYLGA